MDKEYDSRKDFVKEQRAKLKENPSGFLKQEVLEPTLDYWKNRPLHAIGTFVMWVAIMYLIFGGIQAINNDMIYCDSTINSYNGKLMYVFNDFVAYYNSQANTMMKSGHSGSGLATNGMDYNNFTYDQQKRIVSDFNKKYSIMCDYNLTKWFNEPIASRLGTTWYGFLKIVTKRK